MADVLKVKNGKYYEYDENQFVFKGPNMKSAHFTVTIPASSTSAEYRIIVSKKDPKKTFPFTLQCFSDANITLEPVITFSEKKVIHDKWTEQNNGGSLSDSSFGINPMYHIRLKEPGSLEAWLQTKKQVASSLILVTLFFI